MFHFVFGIQCTKLELKIKMKLETKNSVVMMFSKECGFFLFYQDI